MAGVIEGNTGSGGRAGDLKLNHRVLPAALKVVKRYPPNTPAGSTTRGPSEVSHLSPSDPGESGAGEDTTCG